MAQGMVGPVYVTVPQMMDLRDRKAEAQRALLSEYDQSVVVALGMNIPGPVKTDAAIERAFDAGCGLLRAALKREGFFVNREMTFKEAAGNILLLSVEGVDALRLKRLGVEIEEGSPLGRLFDIDVYGRDGLGVSRDAVGACERRCFLCGELAKVCGRSRKHSVEALFSRVHEIIEEWERG